MNSSLDGQKHSREGAKYAKVAKQTEAFQLAFLCFAVLIPTGATADCPLPAAHCLLPTAYCLLPTAFLRQRDSDLKHRTLAWLAQRADGSAMGLGDPLPDG